MNSQDQTEASFPKFCATAGNINFKLDFKNHFYHAIFYGNDQNHVGGPNNYLPDLKKF